MRKVVVIALLVLSMLSGSSVLWAKSGIAGTSKKGSLPYYYPPQDNSQTYEHQGYGIMSPYYGYGMSPTVLGPGLGPGYGYGVGPGMMGPGGGYGWGMMAPAGYWEGRGQDWYAMSPKDRATWRNMYNDFQNDTLKLRKDLMEKQLELDTLLSNPHPDHGSIKTAANDLVDLQAKLSKEQNQFFEKWQEYYSKRVKAPEVR